MSHGHRHEDILNYTMAQFHAYLGLTYRRDRAALRRDVMVSGLAHLDATRIASVLQMLQD